MVLLALMILWCQFVILKSEELLEDPRKQPRVVHSTEDHWDCHAWQNTGLELCQ